MLLFAALTLSLPLATENPSQEQLYRRLQDVDRVTPEVLVVGAVAPAVVFIETEMTQRVNTLFGLQNRTLAGAGSGVVVHADGYIVTNYHVVEGAQSITVTFDGDPHRYPAELVSFVRSEDLALLHIDPLPGRKDGFPTVRLGTSSDLMRGERVVAIGNPHGQAHTVSTGIISGLHRDVPVPDRGLHFQGLIQTDASINLGNSGGPLLNIRGELIGINAVMNTMAENIGFAIPVDRVREVLTQTLFPQAQQRWLGITLAQGAPATVAQVIPGSPADQAGICEGARILSLNGHPVANQEEYLHAALDLPQSGPIHMRIATGEEERDLVLEPWDRIDGVLFERLGMTVRERRLQRQNWIVVDRVSPSGPAGELGLRPGDLIPAIQVAGTISPVRVRARSTLAQLIDRLAPGTQIALNVFRDENQDHDYSEDELYQGELTLR